jgi:hypothetical protein
MVASVSLLAPLLDLWLSFLAIVTSFGTILVMWVNHPPSVPACANHGLSVSLLERFTSEAVFDRIAMSAFEGAPLNMVLRDSTVTDARGAGNEAAAQRSLDSVRFAGNAVLADTDTICEFFVAKSHYLK